MKIFRWVPDEATDGTSPNHPFTVLTLPDTTLLPPKRPFFVPDHTQQCEATLCVALRIDRLGRSIAARFAHRYYKASQASVAVHFIARDEWQRCRQLRLPWSSAMAFDDAVALPATVQADLSVLGQVQWQVGPGEPVEVSLPTGLFAQADELLAYISQLHTLRQGDLLLMPLSAAAQPAVPDTSVCICSQGITLLQFNIK